jgi:hypothetical protein
VTSTQSLSLQKKKVDGIVEEYRDIFSSPTEILMHYQVNHPIYITPSAPLPNGPVYHLSWMENEEIKQLIQEFLQNGNIMLEYDGCAHFTIDNITIVNQP